jgi:hypothetical protein
MGLTSAIRSLTSDDPTPLLDPPYFTSETLAVLAAHWDAKPVYIALTYDRLAQVDRAFALGWVHTGYDVVEEAGPDNFATAWKQAEWGKLTWGWLLYGARLSGAERRDALADLSAETVDSLYCLAALRGQVLPDRTLVPLTPPEPLWRRLIRTAKAT